jgi:hypothetical protein
MAMLQQQPAITLLGTMSEILNEPQNRELRPAVAEDCHIYPYLRLIISARGTQPEAEGRMMRTYNSTTALSTRFAALNQRLEAAIALTLLEPDLLTGTNVIARPLAIVFCLTDVSGGRTFPVHSLKKIGDAAGQLAIELRNQYLIGYRPTPLERDGKWHRVAVRVAPRQNLTRLHVYAKAGYYAPPQ